MSTPAKSNVIGFGVYEFNVVTRELRKNGMRIRLEGQPLTILELLLERPGELVTREELRNKLWPAETFVDFEHSLNAGVKRLRAVLSDSAEQPRYIETQARRGYRFIAPVDHVGASAQAIADVPPASVEGARLTARRWRLIATIALCIAGLSGWGWHRWLNRSIAAPVPAIRSLAVLPLKNLSGDSSQEYLADGMTEDLIGRLSKIRDLRVRSRTSVMRFKNTQFSVPEIAKTLSVDAIVEGSVIREGSRVRVHAQLIRAATDEHFWSETYDREFDDLLAMQNDVAEAISEQIQIHLTPEQQAGLHSEPVVKPQAYEAYLKGRFYGENAIGSTLVALKQAQSYYEDAIRKDPTFARAYAGLADCYLDQGSFRLAPPEEAYRLGSEAIHKALRLDPALGEAYASLGYLDWRFAWQWQTAEKELRYAVQLNPNSIESHESLIWYLAWSGRTREALAEVEKLRGLDPSYPFLSLQESGVYYHQRQYRSLLEAGEKSVDSYPNGWPSHYFLAVGYEGLGQPAQAILEYQRAVELSKGDTDAMAALAHAYVAAGRRAEAAKILRELQARSKADYVSPYMMGIIYASLGSKLKAFEFLENAYKEKSPDMAYFLKADLRLDSLRSDPRMQDLLRRMNFPK